MSHRDWYEAPELRAYLGSSLVQSLHDYYQGDLSFKESQKLCGDTLAGPIATVREQLANSPGYILPPVNVQDDYGLEDSQVVLCCDNKIFYDADMSGCVRDYVWALGDEVKYPVWWIKSAQALRLFATDVLFRWGLVKFVHEGGVSRATPRQRPHVFR